MIELGDIVKILVAILVGGLIGIEREFRDKAAGFRTLICICVGAALFTILSLHIGKDTRIAANIVSGVGFLGAGVILREGGRVIGLTTAAIIWLTAALGMGIGGGYYGLVGFTVSALLIVLWLFPWLERHIDRIREERTYTVAGTLTAARLRAIEQEFRRRGLIVHNSHQQKSGASLHCAWEVSGTPQQHDQILQILLADPDIADLRY